jgi:hypothetical protein
MKEKSVPQRLITLVGCNTPGSAKLWAANDWTEISNLTVAVTCSPLQYSFQTLAFWFCICFLDVNLLRYKYVVRFEVLTAASMKLVVFWVVAPCNLVDAYRRFRGPSCLRHQYDDSSPYQTTRRNNPEDSHFQRYSWRSQSTVEIPHRSRVLCCWS